MVMFIGLLMGVYDDVSQELKKKKRRSGVMEVKGTGPLLGT